MKRIVVISILTGMIILLILTPIIDVKSQQVTIYLSEMYVVHKYGGNLQCNLKIEVLGDIGVLEIKYPNYQPEKIIDLEAKYGDKKIPVQLDQVKNDTILRIDMREVAGAEKVVSVKYVVPLAVKTSDGRIYNITIPYAPVLEYNLTRLNISITLPLGVEPTISPQDMIKKMVKMERGEQQFQLYAVLKDEKAREKQGKLINLRLRGKVEAAIQILKVNMTRRVNVDKDATYTVEDIMRLRNLCGTTLEKGTIMVFNKTSAITDIEAYSSVKQPLKMNIKDQVVEVQTPYILKQDESLTIILRYKVNPYERFQEGIIPTKVKIPIKDFIYSTYYIEQIKMEVSTLDSKTTMLLTDQIWSVKKEITRVVIKTTPYMIMENMAPVLYVITMAGIIMTISRIPKAKILLNKQIKNYIRIVQQEIHVIKQMIELEEKYSERKIKTKQYMQQIEHLQQKLKTTQQKIEKQEKTVKEVFSEVVQTRQQLKETLDQLRKLQQQLRQRKIAPREYMQQKEKVIHQLNVQIAKLQIQIT